MQPSSWRWPPSHCPSSSCSTNCRLLRAGTVFICLAAAALVPWRLHNADASREDVRGINPVEAAAVSAVVAGMPDPAVLLDRAGRVIHLNAAAAQLAPALRRNELAQFALRSPEIITALREAIATSEPRRAAYLDHVPVDRWMELIITPVPVPSTFGGTEQVHADDFPRPDAVAAGRGNARRLRRQCQP